jgi:histidinol-phosphate aminotransferase
MFSLEKLVRENVKKLTPYSCARDDYMGKAGIFLDANENPYGSLNRYPDPYQRKLKEAICLIRGVSEEHLFLGNGSDEVIDIIFRIFCNPGIDKAMIFPPTYGMYEVSASINDVEVVEVPLKDDFQINIPEAEKYLSDENLKLLFICSPNNPTGNCIDPDDINHIVKNFNGIVVIDEAYMDFCNNFTFIDKIRQYPNLIVMRTFSKAHGLAAIRIGAAYASQEIIRYFNKVKPPYNISAINQEAAYRRLINGESFINHVLEIKNERERVKNELLRFSFTIKVFPSDANFLLVKVKDANYLYNYLVQNGIVVRNRSSAVDNCLRITIGTRSENDSLLEALKQVEI